MTRMMKCRLIMLFGALALTFLTSHAQETKIETNSNTKFETAKSAYEQQHYGESRRLFKGILEETANKHSAIYTEAAYYVAANAFELKLKEARTELERYLNHYPYSAMRPRVCYMIGRLYYEEKNYETALKWYNQLKAKDLMGKDNAEYLYTKGYAHISLKQYEPARAIFQALNGTSSKYATEALYYYSYSEFCLNQFDKAQEGFEKLTDNRKYGEAASFHLLQIYNQKGDYTKAVEYGKALLKQYPNSEYQSEAYRILGESAYRADAFFDAIDYLKKYEASEKKVQRSNMYMLGNSYFNVQDYKNAVWYLSKVTSENDSLAQSAYYNIGVCYTKQNDQSNARMAFQSAASLNFLPQLKEEALYNFAIATYETSSPFGEAVTAFERFIVEYPKSRHTDEIYGLLASTYLSEKNYAKAYESIKHIQGNYPKIKAAKEHALFQLGVASFLSQEYQVALEYFTLSIAEFTKSSYSAQAYLWRGETYYKVGTYDKCRQDLLKFVDLPQKKTQEEILKAYYTTAYSYFEQTKYMAALEWFQKFLHEEKNRKNPLYPDVLNRTGDCYYYARELETARNYYNQVSSTNTAHADYAAFQNGFILGLQKRYTQKINAMEALLSKYPSSDYADDALYEIGRTEVLLEQYTKAIATYNRLMEQFPRTAIARKASLEIGMLYANLGDTDQAIDAYKNVVASYPTSEEARVAIESLQTIYLDRNQVNEYISYRESIAGKTISTVPKSQEDSLNFIAAERLFAKKDYITAITSLKTYIVKFCEKHTLNCIAAQYYLAESYYNNGQKKESLPEYEKLIQMEGNSYMETALLRASEITYDDKNYTKSLDYFDQLFQLASNKDNKNAARLGTLRCNYKLNNYSRTLEVADAMLNETTDDATLIREARYCRAKAYLGLKEQVKAEGDLKELSKDLRQEMGAEAKYLYAQLLFDKGKAMSAEVEIMDFIEKNTPHQYWLARCFILLADIYISQGDDFQAKQYLRSLQENYKAENDIQEMISSRLDEINAREKETVY